MPIYGKQLADNSVDADKLLDASFDTSAVYSKFGTGAFTETNVDAVFAAAAINTDRLKEGSSFIKSDGSVAMAAALPMGSNKITGLADGTADTDAATYGQLQQALAGLDFQPDIDVKVANATTSYPGDGTLPAAATGQRYILESGTGSLHANWGTITGVGDDDIVEYNGSAWEVAYDVSVQGEGAITWNRDQDTFEYWTTAWAEFGGLAGVTAGAGLTKTGNTINVGDVNKGVQANADDLQVDANEIAGDGLEQLSGVGNEHILKVKPDSTTGGTVKPVDVGSNGVGFDIDDADGIGLQITSNLLAVKPDSTTGGNTKAVTVGANGVGVDVDTLDGNGLEISGNLLAVKPDVTTGGDTAPVAVGANGTGVDVTALDGDHLDVDFTPSYYSPDASPAEAADADDLAAHLKGIDTAIGSANNKFKAPTGGATDFQDMTALAVSGSNGKATNTTFATGKLPQCDPQAYINGIRYSFGWSTSGCVFFATADAGSTARATYDVIADGDEIYFNPTAAGFDLEATDKVSLEFDRV